MQPGLIRSLAFTLACTAATAMPTFAQPDQPSPQPEQRPESKFADQQGDARQDGDGPGEGHGEGREGRGEGRPSDDPLGVAREPAPFEVLPEDWKKAMEFMQEYAPKRASMLADLPEDFQHRIRETFFMTFRQLERIRNTDRDVYDIRLRRITAEDEVQAVRHAVRWRGQVLTPEEVSKLREKVTQLVDVHLEERELRVQRLRDIIKREEEYLSRDKAQREALINETVAATEQGQRGGLLGGGFGGRGSGGPGSGPGDAPPQRPPGPVR